MSKDRTNNEKKEKAPPIPKFSMPSKPKDNPSNAQLRPTSATMNDDISFIVKQDKKYGEKVKGIKSDSPT